MKNWQKICCVLALVGAMSTLTMAEDVLKIAENPDADVVEAVELPTFVHAEQIQITSSMASDNSDLTPLYDLSSETTVTFATAEDGVDISMTSAEAFRLYSIVVNETETKYDATLYASKDGENWVEVKFNRKSVDGFEVFQTKALGRDYKFYRLHADTKDGETLTFHTLAMYEKQEDVWPFSLYQMSRSRMAQH